MATDPVRTGQVSPDDLHVWDGAGWRPIRGHRWEPTAATPRVQLLAGAFLLLAGLLEVVLATLTRDSVRQATAAAVQQQNSGLSAEEVRRVVDFSVDVGIGAAIAVGVVYLVLGVLTLARRPPWLFYADLVVFGLMSLEIPITLAGVGRGSAGPAAFVVPNLVIAVLALCLFAWMLVVRFRVGPWACLKTAI
jgi:hypothetical protein